MPIIVGSVVTKDDKFLLVQEAQERCRGKWNLPTGHLEPGETLLQGAIRETKEECGLDVQPTGVCQIGNKIVDGDVFMSTIFATAITGGEIAFDPQEILDVKWFSYEEITAMSDQLRNPTMIIRAIENVRDGLVAPLALISNYDENTNHA